MITMYLSAAVVPPWSLRTALHLDLAALCAEVSVLPDPGLPWWRRARDTDAVAAGATGADISVAPVTNMVAHLTRFGYVDHAGAGRLRESLTELASSYEPALLSLGGSSYVDTARNLVLIGVTGQVEAVEEVFHAIHSTVGRLGFFQDRRDFELAVPVLQLPPAFDPDRIARVRSALESYLSDPWSLTSLGLVTQEFPGGKAQVAVLDEIELGPGRESGACCTP